MQIFILYMGNNTSENYIEYKMDVIYLLITLIIILLYIVIY